MSYDKTLEEWRARILAKYPSDALENRITTAIHTWSKGIGGVGVRTSERALKRVHDATDRLKVKGAA